MRIARGVAAGYAGGALHAMFEIGSAQFFEHHDWYPEEIFTTSAGGPIGIATALQRTKTLPRIFYSIRRLYARDYRKLFLDPISRGRMPVLNASAVFKMDEIENIVDREISFPALRRSPIPVWLAAVDLLSGETLWVSTHDEELTDDELRSVLLGSMRVSPLYPAVHCTLKGKRRCLVDSGTIANIPVEKALERGFKKIIIVEPVPHTLAEITDDPRDTISNHNARHSDIKHNTEGRRHLRRVEDVNSYLRVLTRIEAALKNLEMSDEARSELAALLTEFPFYDKNEIDLCRINAPQNLSVFTRGIYGSYGAITDAVRIELMRAGMKEAERVLDPFIKKHTALLYERGPRESPHEHFMNSLRDRGIL